MDKRRDVRRGASRFSRQRIKQSGQMLLSGSDNVDDFVSSEKSKKERLVKKLSVINKESSSYENCDMGCDMSDRENEVPSQSESLICNDTAKRFKLPKKFSNGCNGVNQASIPRKLRSAVKKRNRESVSPPLPDSKKLNHSIQKDGSKKSKLSMKQGSSNWFTKQADMGPITKDEEEVVETLYALAGMFPENNITNKSKLESSPSEVKTPTSPQCRESSAPACKDPSAVKEESSSTMRISETAPSANVESSLKETVKNVNSFNEPAVQEQPESHTGKSLCVKSDSCILQGNPQSMNFSSDKKEHDNDDDPLCYPINYPVHPEVNLDSGSMKSALNEISHPERKQQFSIKSKSVQQDMAMESGKNGLALWLELSPKTSHGSGVHVSLRNYRSTDADAEAPAWLDATVCSPRSSSGKVSNVAVNGKSLKKCAAHVYISHLIRDLQTPHNKEKLPLQQNQMKPLLEGPKQETLMENHNSEKPRKGLINGFTLSNNIGSSAIERKNQSEDRSGNLQHRRLLRMQQHQQSDVPSQELTVKKQNFDFLSLSAGGGGLEASKTVNRIGNNGLISSPQNFQVPYLGSYTQHQAVMPSSMLQTQFSSTYSNQLSTSVSATAQQQVQQLQLPQYIGNPFLGLGPQQHINVPVFTKQQQQQQQQQLWAAHQLTAQYRNMGNTPTNQFPSWLNGRMDPSMIACHQPVLPHSPSSLEVLGPKYAPISQHQQQPFGAISSPLHHARVKRQDHTHHHIPTVEVEAGFRTSSGALPLQLLCNEHL